MSQRFTVCKSDGNRRPADIQGEVNQLFEGDEPPSSGGGAEGEDAAGAEVVVVQVVLKEMGSTLSKELASCTLYVLAELQPCGDWRRCIHFTGCHDICTFNSCFLHVQNVPKRNGTRTNRSAVTRTGGCKADLGDTNMGRRKGEEEEEEEEEEEGEGGGRAFLLDRATQTATNPSRVHSSSSSCGTRLHRQPPRSRVCVLTAPPPLTPRSGVVVILRGAVAPQRAREGGGRRLGPASAAWASPQSTGSVSSSRSAGATLSITVTAHATALAQCQEGETAEPAGLKKLISNYF
ncbi:hypothetical protein EYF80_013383 [Liparis tanakae]|uniref:Uncharacterized protein n=1 Tax=Liparis tanakae TaxID=230148 RepID=A0A4Z2IEV8_9TELE|nr:hypothetical protein EYF80_013383 [Liparis tanakae]